MTHLDAKTIKRLQKAGRKARMMDDTRTGEPGLGVDVRPTGRAVFFWRRWAHGKARRIPIGEFPAWSVAAARERAHELNRKRASDDLPRQAIRLSSFWAIYQERHLATLSTATQRAYNDAWLTLAPLHHMPADRITRADVACLLADLHNSPAWANKVRACLSSVLGRAEDWGYIDAAPRLPRPHKMRRRDRWLTPAEYQRLLAEVDKQPDPLPDMVRLLLLTGSRKAEVCAMRWDQINLDDGIWRRVQKGGSVAPTMLASAAVDILLARRRAQTGDKTRRWSPWVFPSSRGDGHIVSPDKPWRAAREAAGMPDVVLHTLRHTFATWLENANVELRVISDQLGHADTGVTEIYTHRSLEAQREAAEIVAKIMKGTG